MRLFEIGDGLRAEPVPALDPITRRPSTSYRIIDASGQLIGGVAGRFAASPEEALQWHRERSQSQSPIAPLVKPPAPQPPPQRRTAPVRRQALYHWTTGPSLLRILEENAIRAWSQHVINDRSVNGISLTRDRQFDYEDSKPFRLMLDRDLIRHRHRLIPVRDAYMANIHKAERVEDTETGWNEAEEFLPGPLRDLDQFLLEVAVRTDLLEGSPRNADIAEHLRGDVPSGIPIVSLDGTSRPWRETRWP